LERIAPLHARSGGVKAGGVQTAAAESYRLYLPHWNRFRKPPPDRAAETLKTILTDYPRAKNEPLAGHPLGSFIRRDAATAVEAALGELGAGLLVEGSAGAGNWAAVPWISVFDPSITTTATRGYYVVYLFHVDKPLVHLSLNQGTTAVREEFGARAREIYGSRSSNQHESDRHRRSAHA
jgi:hypothetical protein